MAKHSKHSIELPMLVAKARAHLPKDEHDSAAKIADAIMARYRPKFREMPGDFFRWCRAGLYEHLCARFKKHGTDETVTRQGILDYWRDDPIALEHVVRFGDSGFYLDKGKGYVDLTPERTITELRAGAAHKRKFGEETIEQAAALDALADHLERKASRH
jgi:hypothetical protein